MKVAFVAGAFLVTALAGAPAGAAEDPKIGIEFNDLQQSDGGCRAVFVLHNGLTDALDELTLRIVAFDGEGRAKLFLALDVGALPVSKTRILRFDLGSDVACKDISRLVLDDVTACSGADMDPAKCLGAVAISSRSDVPFDY